MNHIGKDPIDGLLDCYVMGQGEVLDIACLPPEVREAWVLAGQGWLAVINNGTLTAASRIKRCDEKDACKSEIVLNCKVPASIVRAAGKFFRATFLKYHGEGFLYLLRRTDDFPPDDSGDHRLHFVSGDWGFFIPKQNSTGAHVGYTGAEAGAFTPPGWSVVGDVHSHGRMNAFHSGTDDHDEMKRDGIHITIGDLDNNDRPYSYSFSVVVSGRRMKLEQNDILFDDDPVTAMVPRWLEQVEGAPEGNGVFLAGGAAGAGAAGYGATGRSSYDPYNPSGGYGLQGSTNHGAQEDRRNYYLGGD